MKPSIRHIAAIAGLGFAGLGMSGAAHAAGDCAGLKSITLTGHTVSVSKAEMMPAGKAPAAPVPGAPPGADLPARCLVEGMIDQRMGAAGKSYGVGFAVALPEAWNGRFLFQGGGGLDGVLNPPVGAIASGGKPALARGFAVAGTDSGHQSKSGFDATFFADQQATVDFEYASIGTVNQLARKIIAAYYGKPAAHAYFTGCSMGGREAMIAAQRYPLQFDGVIAGAPAMHVGYSGIGDKWVSTMLNTIAPKGSDDKPDVSKVFTEGEKKTIINGILNACDAKDGLKDGMIMDVKDCHFDPAVLICKGEKSDSCLTRIPDGRHRARLRGANRFQGTSSLSRLLLRHRAHRERLHRRAAQSRTEPGRRPELCNVHGCRQGSGQRRGQCGEPGRRYRPLGLAQ